MKFKFARNGDTRPGHIYKLIFALYCPVASKSLETLIKSCKHLVN